MPGLIGVRETRSGTIRHALRFIVPDAKIRQLSYVAPATHSTPTSSSESGPPYGVRLRLRPSFDESRIASSGGQAIVRALKRYGMFLADQGIIPLTAESDRFEKMNDPTMTWDGVLSERDLVGMEPSDFEVLTYGEVRTGDDCTLPTADERVRYLLRK